MEVQEIAVVLLFLIATIYVGRMIYRSFNSEKGCASNCNKCGVDFSDIDLKK
jgi:hypothetical protein